LLIVGWRKCHWWNFAIAGDRHPELLDLEWFINHAKEHNEDLKLCLNSVEI
jgi:hypothetical protein